MGLLDLSTGSQYIIIQIVHDLTHWVATACIGEEVLVADSLGKATLSDRVKAQLQQLYASQIKESGMQVTMVPCPRQTNGSDCGVYAAAVAYAWAEGQTLPLEWDVARMRPYLIKSLEQARVSSFPIGKERRGRRPKKVTVHIEV